MKLDEFIENCSQAGKFESEGSFSVDSLSAFRKTLASALPEPHFYLFQLLQGVIKAGSSDIKVAVGRRGNRISFQDPSGAFSDLGALAARFQKGLSVSSDNPLDLVMSGLVTSLGCHMSSAEFYYGAHRLQVDVNGVRQEQLPRQTEEPHILLRRSVEKGLSYSWSRIWGARKEEFRIRKAFEYSPVPLQIAGLSTSPKPRWRRTIDGENIFGLVEAVFLAPESPNHRGEPAPASEQMEGTLRLGATAQKTVGTETAVAPSLTLLAFDLDGLPLEAPLEASQWDQRRWTFCLTNRRNLKAEVEWVRNGLTVAHEELALGYPGLHLVAPADHLEVDASAYQLVKNRAYEETIEEARTRLARLDECLDRVALRRALKRLERDPHELLSDFPYLTE